MSEIPLRTMKIIRGCPGAGKSTYAQFLCSKEQPGDCIICEADEFMYENGIYKFHPNKLSYCHNKCFEKAGKALKDGVKLVIVSNTNTRKKEFQKYLDAAQEAGYTIIVFRMTKNYGNIHGVPDEKVKEMHDRIEPFEGEILIDEYR